MTAHIPHGYRVVVGGVDACACRVRPADLVLVVVGELGGLIRCLLHGTVLPERTHVVALACMHETERIVTCIWNFETNIRMHTIVKIDI